MAINDLTTDRIKATFARVERQGLKSALWVRLITLLIVQAWLIIAVPKYWTLFYHFWIVVFLALGATQLFLIRRASDARWQPYVFAIVDGVLLAAAANLP